MSTSSSTIPRPITTTASFPNSSLPSLLTVLHLPNLLLQLNPLVQSFHPVTTSTSSSESSSSPSPIEYAITDLIPLLGGLWSTRTSYTASFTPIPDGMLVDIRAAMGVTTKSTWTVREAKDGAGSEVTEASEVTISGGAIWDWMLRGHVEAQIKSSHGVLMKRLRDKVDEMGRVEG